MNRNILIGTITLIIFLIACSAIAADSFILVSDVDDTVKITDVHNRDNLSCNVVAGKLVFAGMPELYAYLLGKNFSAERLMFLSGAPFIFSFNLHKLLNDAHFPAYNLTLSGATDLFSSHYEYKTKHMKELYGATEGYNFILIGDDTEYDPEVYANFSTSFKQNKVLAIYIHKITGRNLPPDSVAFVTAYDIAIHEFLAGRLSEKQTADVGEAVFKSDDAAFLPGFQQCPKKYEQIAGLSENLIQLKKKIEDRITIICSSRTKALKEQ